MPDDIDPTPQGLLRCLQALSEEAASMSLSRTFAALQDAIIACYEEGAPFRPGALFALPASLLH